MQYTLIKVERHHPLAVITLNRPEKRNALSPQLIAELFQVVSGQRETPP